MMPNLSTPLANPARCLSLASLSSAMLALALGLFAGLSPAAAEGAARSWISTWTASPQVPRGAIPISFSNQTVRQVVHVSVGGEKVTLRLSNEFGTRPVLIGAASVATAAKGSDVVAGTLHPVTFGGEKSIILPPGTPAVSDPVELEVAPLSDIAVTLYLPDTTELGTVHQVGLQTAYVSAGGDFTATAQFPVADRFANRFFLAGLMVEAAAPARAIVTFGDSITDGTNSTVNANHRWPDVLAQRLHDAGMPVAVQNQGIAGNRVLSDGGGVSGMARFDRDVLGEPGVSHIVLLLGINDIGTPGAAFEPRGVVRTADEIVAGLKQLVERAHLHAIKVIASPLTPFEHAFGGTPNQAYYSPDKEAKRVAVNKWIRSSGIFDGLLDFDRVLADPNHPSAIAPAYDSGDHLHPNDAGYRAMAESIDLNLFR